MHELYHGMGFLHMDKCQSGQPLPPCNDNPNEPGVQICGTMVGHGLDSESYEMEYADWEGLMSVYGDWAQDGVYRRISSDADTWSTMPTIAAFSAPFMGSDWSQGSTYFPLAFLDGNFDPHYYRWRLSTDTYVDWGGSIRRGDSLAR